jgi:hypothetical protein
MALLHQTHQTVNNFTYILGLMKRLEQQNEEDKYSCKKIGDVHAFAHNRLGEIGYAIRYEDGYIGWLPKLTFEKYFKPSALEPSK